MCITWNNFSPKLLGLETNFKWIWHIFVNLVFKKSGLFWEERAVMNQLKRLISENAPVMLCPYPVIPHHGLPALFSMLIRSDVSTNCKPHWRDSSSNLVWVTQEVLIHGSCPDLSGLTSYLQGSHYVCVSEALCFLTLLLGAPHQSVFTDGITATSAQTAELCSCGERSHCLK